MYPPTTPTPTAPASTDAETVTKTEADDPVDVLDSKPAKTIQKGVERCKQEKRDHLVNDWSTNVDYRRGKPFNTTSDFDRVNVNIDWSLTKSKQAQLYSQWPTVYLTPKRPEFKVATAKFGKDLNDTLTKAKTGAAVNECVIDVINAAGVAGVVCLYRATTQKKMVPLQDPSTMPPTGQPPLPGMGGPGPDPSQPPMDGQMMTPPMPPAPPQMVETTETVDTQYSTLRRSPADLLWPLEFTGSDFEQADWVGHTGRMLWSEGQREFGLTEEQKRSVLTVRSKDDTLRQDQSANSIDTDPVVEYDEIFYWNYRYDPNEKYFDKIHRIVFVEGLDEPVIHEPWKGQKFDEQAGKYVGSCRRPVIFLTLTYISDDAIPPSDTAIGRPQVNELIRARTQIIEQRERSKPLRWMDINRIDPMIQDTLMRGTWQGIIPVQGNGEKAIGEVARSAYPREEFEFDRVAKGDLNEQWQTGPNQSGAFAEGPRSAREAGIVEQNFQTRVGYEKSRIAEFITAIAEVHAGFLALFGPSDYLSEQEKQALTQSWDRTHIANEFVYYIRPDSTVLLDAGQRIAQLEKLLNLVAKSPFVNPQPIVEELVALHGVDPTTVIVQPQPQKPQEPNISLRLDEAGLMNPLTLAMLIKSGQAPSPEELTAAKNLLVAAYGQNLPPEMGPLAQGGPPPSGPVGQGQPPAPGSDARPEWGPMNRLTKRIEEPGG